MEPKRQTGDKSPSIYARKWCKKCDGNINELLTLLNWPLEAGVPAPGGSVYERLQRSPDDASEAPPA